MRHISFVPLAVQSRQKTGRWLAGILLLTVSAGIATAAEPRSPFADKPCDSYSSYNDAVGKPVPLIWGQAPFNDFGSRPVAFDTAGVRKLNPAPPPGVHPRICFGPADLPEVRKRIKETRCGQEEWKNILCWTESMKGLYNDQADYAKPDRWNGSFGGLHGRHHARGRAAVHHDVRLVNISPQQTAPGCHQNRTHHTEDNDKSH